MATVRSRHRRTSRPPPWPPRCCRARPGTGATRGARRTATRSRTGPAGTAVHSKETGSRDQPAPARARAVRASHGLRRLRSFGLTSSRRFAARVCWRQIVPSAAPRQLAGRDGAVGGRRARRMRWAVEWLRRAPVAAVQRAPIGGRPGSLRGLTLPLLPRVMGWKWFLTIHLLTFMPNTAPWTVEVRKCMPPAIRASWSSFTRSSVESK